MKLHQHADRRRGAAMVEMAVVLPVFLMVVMGIIEFGRGMMISNLVTNAAREAARAAVLDGSTNAAVTSAARTFLRSAISSNLTDTDIPVTITITPATGNTDPGNVLANCNSRDLISVQVSIPFNKVALIPGDYLAGKNLVGKSSMRHE